MFKHRNKSGRGATLYLLISAAILIITILSIYFFTGAGEYPPLGAKPSSSEGDLVINVNAGGIPAGEWQVKIYENSSGHVEPSGVTSERESEDWHTVNKNLAPPSVALIEEADGTYNVSLRHKDTGHVYFSEQTVTVG